MKDRCEMIYDSNLTPYEIVLNQSKNKEPERLIEIKTKMVNDILFPNSSNGIEYILNYSIFICTNNSNKNNNKNIFKNAKL